MRALVCTQFEPFGHKRDINKMSDKMNITFLLNNKEAPPIQKISHKNTMRLADADNNVNHSSFLLDASQYYEPYKKRQRMLRERNSTLTGDHSFYTPPHQSEPFTQSINVAFLQSSVPSPPSHHQRDSENIPEKSSSDSGVVDKSCKICGKTFTRKSSVVKHIRSVHLNHRPYSCDQCSWTFTQKSSLQSHVLSVHMRVRQFQCEHCKSWFSLKGDLHRHIRTVHLKIKAFSCDVCDLRFGLKSQLEVHRRSIHEKVKK